MTKKTHRTFFDFSFPLLDKKRARHVPIYVLTEKEFPVWLKTQSKIIRALCHETGFSAQIDKTLCVRDSGGKLDCVLLGVAAPVSLYSGAVAAASLRSSLSPSVLNTTSFFLSAKNLNPQDTEKLVTGWGLGAYAFGHKEPSQNAGPYPALLWPDHIDRHKILCLLRAIFLLRHMVNAPANAMGPQEMEDIAHEIAREHRAAFHLIKGPKLEKDFPLVHAVGRGSDRAPCLIEFHWGRVGDPKLTLVGKGVAFDTGGLNIKPSASMALMKKDMGGAAHVLALAQMIMTHNLPVRLRVLIPAVENSISGDAFRPGDIIRSRKGLYVENTNTDAEGRLILADALDYACEDKPDLIIDFATLTGSARAALGPDIPPVFSNQENLAKQLSDIGFSCEDPVWPMPLWPAYKRFIDSPVADLQNSQGVPGDLTYSALFLYQFIRQTKSEPDWMHLDVYAWEQTGRPGRPKGGAENGLRATFALIEERYGRRKKSRR